MKFSLIPCLAFVAAFLACVHDTQGASSLRSSRDLSKVGSFFKKVGQDVKKEAVKVDQGVKKDLKVVNEKVLVPIEKKVESVVNFEKIKADAQSLWRKAKCSALEYAGQKLFEEGDLETKEACGKLSTKAAEFCEEVGGGPEDPLADVCVALVKGPGQNECVKLVNEGLHFTFDKLKEAVHC